MTATSADLPRLIYVGVVPVEASYHGSALLYRLLAAYPPERLLIVEVGPSSQPERRLPGVEYRRIPLRHANLQNRFLWQLRLTVSILGGAGGSPRAELTRQAKDFGAEAVLTVTHEAAWLEAAQLAETMDLPLHLICHDDWIRYTHPPKVIVGRARRIFGQRYRQSASRMCVSPEMANQYGREFGPAAVVLYPSRAADATTYEAPPSRLARPLKRLTVAFAGSLHASLVPGCVQLARLLKPLGGRLQIYSPSRVEDLRAAGLDGDEVEFRGLLPSSEVIDRLRDEADVLFANLPFGETFRDDATYSFPSKLTDYTAAGVPILLQAPPYSAAAAWARQNPGATLLVDDPSDQSLGAALERLRQDGTLRTALATAALAAGARTFSASAANNLFLACIRGDQTQSGTH